MMLRRFTPGVPIEVTACQRAGQPARLRWRGRAYRVARVEAAWETVQGWWADAPEAVRRRSYRLLLADGTLCLVYRDLGSGRWYLAGIFD